MNEKQKSWTLAHSSMRSLITSTNKLVKERKIGFKELKEILSFYNNSDKNKLL